VVECWGGGATAMADGGDCWKNRLSIIVGCITLCLSADIYRVQDFCGQGTSIYIC
jgi:hypothetical protein